MHCLRFSGVYVYTYYVCHTYAKIEHVRLAFVRVLHKTEYIGNICSSLAAYPYSTSL